MALVSALEIVANMALVFRCCEDLLNIKTHQTASVVDV